MSYADSSILSETELMQYYRQFRPIAIWLINNNKMSTREHNQWFWHGLPAHARNAIARHLELQHPTTYSHTDPSDYEDVVMARRFVFSDDAFDAEYDDPLASHLKTIR